MNQSPREHQFNQHPGSIDCGYLNSHNLTEPRNSTMWSKTKRQTIFDKVSTVPGPGAYDPKDTKKPTGNVAFGKQTDRFRREDSTLSNCSTSTTSSATLKVNSRFNSFRERLRTYEKQIQERDNHIFRLKSERDHAMTRQKMLFDAYKALRRVSCQLVPATKLPKDMTQDFMRMLQEEKAKLCEEYRPSMSEHEIQDHSSTFIVELEKVDDPMLIDGEKRLAELRKELENSAVEIGRLKFELKTVEFKDSQIAGLENQLRQTSEQLANKDQQVITILRDLGEAKAELANLSCSLAHQNNKMEEATANADRTVTSLKGELSSKENALRELEKKMDELTVTLRESQTERERLAQKLDSTVDTLEKVSRENGDIEQKFLLTEDQLANMKAKIESRKAELSELEAQLSEEKSRREQVEKMLEATENQLEQLRIEFEQNQASSGMMKHEFQLQLQQSQDNFERQLDEARKIHELLAAQKADIESELNVCENRIRTLEDQVVTRDELLGKNQKQLAETESKLQDEQVNLQAALSELSEAQKHVENLVAELTSCRAMEAQAKDEVEKLSGQLNEIERSLDAASKNQSVLEEERNNLEQTKTALQKQLDEAFCQKTELETKLQALENEASSMKLMNLATTAELEQTKVSLIAAEKISAELESVRQQLTTTLDEKQRAETSLKNLEEEVQKWSRVRDSLKQQLQEREQQYNEALQNHIAQVELRERNIKSLEAHLESVKASQEEELTKMREVFEKDRRELLEASSTHLADLNQQIANEKRQFEERIEALTAENEFLKNDSNALINAKASLTLQLQSKEAEVLNLRSKAAEVSFYSSKCLELERDAIHAREICLHLQDEMNVLKQDLTIVSNDLEVERRNNRAHSLFTMALIKSNATGQNTEALQLENDNLRHQLSSVTQLLDTLENGIQTSEAKNSVYVKSCNEMQQQIQRLVGHSNSKQRIQIVGKLQTENRQLKEELVQLRGRCDTLQKKLNQQETQLRRLKDKENRPEQSVLGNMSTMPSKFL